MSVVAPEPAAAADPRLSRLYDLVLERLIEILAEGLPVQKTDAKTGETRQVGRTPAPPAYVSAAIKLLKDAGRWSGQGDEDRLESLLEGLPSFEDGEDDDPEDGDDGDDVASRAAARRR